MHEEPARGYILNVYTEAPHRGRGLARRLTDSAIAEAQCRGLHVLFLHATEAGRPLYAKAGFGRSTKCSCTCPRLLPQA